MSAPTPQVRTHSLRTVMVQEAHAPVQEVRWECRGCNRSWPLNIDAEWLEGQPCGTPTNNPPTQPGETP